ncbi:unnamed protein product [Mytilus coruscus]|uniref:Uncharacterized protein n=1 Tax=Mytilus coruscus TaxID=42192 RepID=A0A6J8AGN0_MYTCO|nr:unnamed protein product [Mytilus coruscus]
MKVGQKILVLLPTKANKLLMHWKGPFSIEEKTGDLDYRIDMRGKIKMFHVNMLKLYVEHEPTILCIGSPEHKVATVPVILIDLENEDTDGVDNYESEFIETPATVANETQRDVHINGALKAKEIVKHHLEVLGSVFERLASANLSARPLKYYKAYNSLKVLVDIVGTDRLSPKRDKIGIDASDKGIGAILLQDEGNIRLPVSYAIKKMKASERNYSTIEKECLAIVWAIRKKFQRFLYGKQFILETDHQPLIYLKKSKIANSRKEKTTSEKIC